MSDNPVRRIQRKRTRGWRLPPNTIIVCRPSIWGNPFKVGTTYKTNAEAVVAFRRALLHGELKTRNGEMLKNKLNELKGFDLACWCRLDECCHADVLLELANACTSCR